MTLSNTRSVNKRSCITLLLVTLGATGTALAIPPTEPKPRVSQGPSVNAPAVKPLPPPKPGEVRQLDWDALLPPEERDHFDEAPPQPVHGYLGEGGPGAIQQGSSSVNLALNKARVKIPGFVVPLDMLPDGNVREFFLVPYFGACIHVPPPPPNQIVYVKMANPIKVASMYDAVWITGTLRTETRMSRFGAAAYTLDGVKVENYTY